MEKNTNLSQVTDYTLYRIHTIMGESPAHSTVSVLDNGYSRNMSACTRFLFYCYYQVDIFTDGT